MAVNPVGASTAILQLIGNSTSASTSKPASNSKTIPQDTVTLSSTAQSKPAPTTGDVDHDGDSK